MRIRHFALILTTILAPVWISAVPAESAPRENRQTESWIGAWGFVPIPLPPGTSPPPPVPAIAPVPLAPTPAQPVAAPATPLLIDNPGNVAVVMPEADPTNVTVRQLVRVAVAGKRIRLRFSNEGGSDVLMLG